MSRQTSVSQNSTDTKRISLDAGLRVDGIPALDLWKMVKGVFHSYPTQTKNPKIKYEENRCMTSHKTIKHKSKPEESIKYHNLEFSNVDYISSNVETFVCKALPC